MESKSWTSTWAWARLPRPEHHPGEVHQVPRSPEHRSCTASRSGNRRRASDRHLRHPHRGNECVVGTSPQPESEGPGPGPLGRGHVTHTQVDHQW